MSRLRHLTTNYINKHAFAKPAKRLKNLTLFCSHLTATGGVTLGVAPAFEFGFASASEIVIVLDLAQTGSYVHGFGQP